MMNSIKPHPLLSPTIFYSLLENVLRLSFKTVLSTATLFLNHNVFWFVFEAPMQQMSLTEHLYFIYLTGVSKQLLDAV